MTFIDIAPYLIGVGAIALVGGFSARRYGSGIAAMYLGVILLLGTAMKMIVDRL